ncbi:MAG: hypothetical protein J3K34DRAFT_407060 [Monoraphidium minutum]|nr:MAG: hypothetical protein J3K34DRAFT_407060 [Monoraphidium minutum]
MRAAVRPRLMGARPTLVSPTKFHLLLFTLTLTRARAARPRACARTHTPRYTNKQTVRPSQCRPAPTQARALRPRRINRLQALQRAPRSEHVGPAVAYPCVRLRPSGGRPSSSRLAPRHRTRARRPKRGAQSVAPPSEPGTPLNACIAGQLGTSPAHRAQATRWGRPGPPHPLPSSPWRDPGRAWAKATPCCAPLSVAARDPVSPLCAYRAPAAHAYSSFAPPCRSAGAHLGRRLPTCLSSTVAAAGAPLGRPLPPPLPKKPYTLAAPCQRVPSAHPSAHRARHPGLRAGSQRPRPTRRAGVGLLCVLGAPSAPCTRQAPNCATWPLPWRCTLLRRHRPTVATPSPPTAAYTRALLLQACSRR